MRLSLKYTLAGLFSLLAIITFVQGAVTFYTLVSIGRGFDNVANTRLPAVNALRELESAVMRFRNDQFRIVTSPPDQDVVMKDLAEMSGIEGEMADACVRYEQLIASPTEHALYDQFMQSWTTYHNLTKPLGDFLLKGQIAEAQQIISRPWLRVVFRTVEDKLRRSVALNTRLANGEASASVASVARAKLTAIAAVLMAATLSIAAFLVSYIRVIQPLTGVSAALRRLASGHTDAPLDLPDRHDEIGAMVSALAVFRQSLLKTNEAEAARLKAQNLFENIAATTPDGIISLSDDGIVTFWNTAAQRLVGFSSDEMVGSAIDKILPKGQGSTWTEALAMRDDLVGRTVETEVQHRTGEVIPVELSFGRWVEGGSMRFCATIRDIRVRRRDEKHLKRLAHSDSLTDLPNRNVFLKLIGADLLARRPAAVLMVDIDHFKNVNDTLGHVAGDTVLKTAASRLVACVGPTGTVTRLGGDEFVILLSGVDDPRRATGMAGAAIRCLSEPFVIDDRSVQLGASVGVAFAPGHGDLPDEILSCADLALNAAKAEGRHKYRVFTPVLRSAASRESACREGLRRAADEGEFRLFYQPQVRLEDGALIGAEALIRWQHPEQGLLAPDQFIDVLETSHFAGQVGEWVIRTACRQAADWRRAGLDDFRIGVNLSNAHYRSGRFANAVMSALKDSGLPASALEVEITEKIVLADDDDLVELLRELQTMGVSLAFDDYGTGYASLSLLKRFPLDRLKVDRSFVRGMTTSHEDAAIVRAVLQLGRDLNLSVIAEGIETAEHLAWLRHEGCEEGQGYLFGRPMPPEMFFEACATPFKVTGDDQAERMRRPAPRLLAS